MFVEVTMKALPCFFYYALGFGLVAKLSKVDLLTVHRHSCPPLTLVQPHPFYSRGIIAPHIGVAVVLRPTSRAKVIDPVVSEISVYMVNKFRDFPVVH
jgi:hypothetical protein